MGAVKRIFGVVLTFQIILFILFMVENIDSLSAVPITYTVDEETEVITVNFYEILIAITTISGIGILAGVSVFGTGFGDEGVKNLVKFVGLMAMIGILTVSSTYYLLQLGFLGNMLQTIILIIYLINTLDSYMGGNE